MAQAGWPTVQDSVEVLGYPRLHHSSLRDLMPSIDRQEAFATHYSTRTMHDKVSRRGRRAGTGIGGCAKASRELESKTRGRGVAAGSRFIRPAHKPGGRGPCWLEACPIAPSERPKPEGRHITNVWSVEFHGPPRSSGVALWLDVQNNLVPAQRGSKLSLRVYLPSLEDSAIHRSNLIYSAGKKRIQRIELRPDRAECQPK